MRPVENQTKTKCRISTELTTEYHWLDQGESGSNRPTSAVWHSADRSFSMTSLFRNPPDGPRVRLGQNACLTTVAEPIAA